MLSVTFSFSVFKCDDYGEGQKGFVDGNPDFGSPLPMLFVAPNSDSVVPNLKIPFTE